MDKKLSVIIPIYNVEKYLRQCIDSVLAQTYSNLEIILVDDGSTDGSGAICDEYASKNNCIIVKHKENEGLIKTRYVGAKMASSEYVTFVDSDDWIDENMYKDMMAYIGGCDMVISQPYRYYDEDNIVAESVIYDGRYEKKDIEKRIIPHMLYCNELNRWAVDPAFWTKIFNKESLLFELEKVKDLNIMYAEDTATIFPYLTRANSIYILPNPYYYHRQRQNGEIPYYIKDDLFFDKLHKVYTYLDGRFKETEYYDVLKPQLERFYIMSVNLKNRVYGESDYGLATVFPFEEICENSKVVIYGAGKLGKEYVKQNEKYHFCNIVKWVDKQYQYIAFEEYKICDPDKIFDEEFDYIIIAIDVYEAALKVKTMLVDRGIEEKKIVWHSLRRKNF